MLVAMEEEERQREKKEGGAVGISTFIYNNQHSLLEVSNKQKHLHAALLPSILNA